MPYTLAVQWRNQQYDRGRKPVERVDVPVISIGNLTLGGTPGKTPLVEWLARWFRQRGVRVTIISRGYGAEAGSQNDEALELEQKLPDVPHVQNPDRVAAAKMAIEEFDCQLILLDDAFQHRRIHRDLNIVVVDALEPFGFGHVFPRGALREPLAGLRRADVVILSRADLVDPAELQQIRSTVASHAPSAIWLEASHRPERLLSASGREEQLASLANQPVAAFCGVGNPAGFRHTLAGIGCQIVEMQEFPDHFAYQRSDVESLTQWAASLPIQAVACTHKDLVKLGVDQLGQRPLWAVVIGLAISAGQSDLESRLTELLSRIPSPSGAPPPSSSRLAPGPSPLICYWSPPVRIGIFSRIMPAAPAKLTVLIPAKNERLNIRPCIESARAIADEILVADSGSTDGTLDIVARIGGCRIIQRELIDFSNFKNWAIPQATHPWVLVLDADERITPELAAEIRDVLADPPEHVDGFWIGRENYFLGHRIRHCGWNSDAVFRLFRRDACRYTNRRVHESMDVEPGRADRLRHDMVHYTVWNYDRYLAKMAHYTRLGAQDLHDRGRKASLGGLLFRVPLRFLQLYVLRLGFLDGLAGVQICMLSAVTSFLKQARLWELENAWLHLQPDPEIAAEPAAA